MLELEFAALGCRVGTGILFSDISLRLQNGNCLFLQGPNGSGKTTFLDCLFGLRKVDVGELILTSQGSASVVTSWSVGQRVRAGFRRVFQKSPLLPPLTAKALIDGVRPTGSNVRRGEDPCHLANIAQLTAMVESFPGLASTYSFGQTRLCLAALILASGGDILLFDEPFEGLSSENNNLLEAALVDSINSGRIIVVADHDKLRGERIASHTLRFGISA
jgi:ABC-type transport system involved in cytochrome c biogenesis ATPase subunit